MPEQVPQDKTVIEETNALRADLAIIAKRIRLLEGVSQPPVVQELVLARRAAEDSRYRLGYAGAYARGLDPLEHTFPDQKKG